MRTFLRIGVAGAFVLVVLGATFDALVVTGVLALLERVGQRREAGG